MAQMKHVFSPVNGGGTFEGLIDPGAVTPLLPVTLAKMMELFYRVKSWTVTDTNPNRAGTYTADGDESTLPPIALNYFGSAGGYQYGINRWFATPTVEDPGVRRVLTITAMGTGDEYFLYAEISIVGETLAFDDLTVSAMSTTGFPTVATPGDYWPFTP